MKNYYYGLMIIAAFAVLTVSCIKDELMETYTVTFDVTPPTATVELNGKAYSDATGTVVIPLVSHGKANYTVSEEGYIPQDGSINVVEDMSHSVTLVENTDTNVVKTNFNVTFLIEPVDQADVEGARLIFDGIEYQDISNTGELTVKYITPKDDIPYSILKSGYKDYSGTVSVVDKDETVNVTLVSNNQDMVFNVTPGATVKMEGRAVKDEDLDGSVTIRNILITGTLPYIVAKVGYAPVEGVVEGATFDPSTDLPISTGSLVSADQGVWIDIRDAVEYSWTKIDTLIWMSENLRYNIPNVSGVSVGGADFPQSGPNPTTDTYTRDQTSWWYANDSLTYNANGRLYSFGGALAAEQNAEGWYLPSWEDYQALGRTLGIPEADLQGGGWKGVDEKAGEQLMSTSWSWDEGIENGGWYNPGGTLHPGTDLWGFNALPAGKGNSDWGPNNDGAFDGSGFGNVTGFLGLWLNSVSASYGGTCMALVLNTEDYWMVKNGAGIQPSNQPMNEPLSVRLVFRVSDIN